MRQGRYVGGNKGTEGPSNLIFFDTESIQHGTNAALAPRHHTLRLWTAIRVRLESGRVTRRSVERGTTGKEFWGFVGSVSDRQRRTWLFAHNLGFDLTLLGFLQQMDTGRFTLQPLYQKRKGAGKAAKRSWSGRFIVDRGVTVVVCRDGRKTYTMVDTCNYWPCKLSEIGYAYGLPKLFMPDDNAPIDDWYAYCQRDTEIVERAVTTLISEWVSDRRGVFKPTAASLAFTDWRHTCDVRTPDGSSPDVVCVPDAPWHELERASYFGGRVQPFYVGELEGPIYHVDVNSLYPYVMKHNSFPRRFVDYGRQDTPDDLRRKSQAYGMCASVLIRSRHDAYPVRVGGKQYHLCGEFWCTLAGPELARALSSGHIVRVGSAQYYSLAPIFGGWVDYWYGRKLAAGQPGNGRDAKRAFAKLILNSLSGKFAQHGRMWADVPGAVAIERWGSWGGGPPPTSVLQHDKLVADVHGKGTDRSVKDRRFNYRGIAGNVQVELPDCEPDHAFPLISSYITSYAREYMLSVIDSLPVRSVYYMATDSLLLSESGYRALVRRGMVHPTRLGAFKLIGTYKRGTVIGSNHYELDGEETVSGLWARAKATASGIPVCEVWDRLPSAIAKGPTATVDVRTVPLIHSAPDRKGWIDPDGWWHPHRMSPDPEFTDKPRTRLYTADDIAERSTCSWK